MNNHRIPRHCERSAAILNVFRNRLLRHSVSRNDDGGAFLADDGEGGTVVLDCRASLAMTGMY